MSNNKKIIGIVMIVFVVLVSYKFISSGIQENKEKAVLQEKYRLEQLSQKALQNCIDEAKTEKKRVLDFYESFDATSCTKLGNSKEWCRTKMYSEGVQWEKEAVELCYRRYK